MIDIYGTLGPSCASRETLERMFRAGMTGIRLNLSHVSLRESAPRLEIFHAAAREAGIRPQLLIDMQGPELRIGSMDGQASLREGDEAALCAPDSPSALPGGCGIPSAGTGAPAGYRKSQPVSRGEYKCVIPVPPEVLAVLEEGREILLDDGKILLKVIRTGGGTAAALVLRGGVLSGRKSVKVPGEDIRPPTMTAADLQNIRDAAAFGVTGVMQPFVRSREDLEEVRAALSGNGAGHLQLVAKIENLDGVRRLDTLLPACDAICIARGDLGNDMPLWQLPAVQKRISEKCRAAGRPFMVATQMLASMETRAVPTRAEVNDIFNTVVDGASGVMVTGETAVGSYPVEVIRFLKNTAEEGEKYRQSYPENRCGALSAGH
ncbi:MAG: pyruvate kinase [Eubacteriales bacterium]|nr:pyruvate kinase [Eubacteriales bacterium]